MKPNLAVIMLLGLIAASPAFAQDISSTNNVAQPPIDAVTNEVAQPVTNATPINSVVEVAPTPVSTTAVAPQPGVIPLIDMPEVPLNDAIKTLGRQASLNYLLDPKIPYGQPGPDGKPGPWPPVTIRWEKLTAQQALLALLNNYDLQLSDDPKTGVARITTKDPAAPPLLVTKIIQLKYANPTNILNNVQGMLMYKNSKAMADIRTSQLVVISTEPEMTEVEKMIKLLDTPTKQVLIEARLLEISINPQTTKGVDWSGTVQHHQLTFGNNLNGGPAGGESNPTLTTSFPKLLFDTSKGMNPATAFLDSDGLSAVVSFLNTSADARVLSTPRTVTLDNETASLQVTRATPIINVSAGTANTAGGSSIQYTNLGVILNVTPRISANNYINLKVVPEVSRIFGTVTKIIQGQTFQADEYDIRKIQTQVMIPSAHTLVLGGLVQDDVRTDNTKIPLLGDMPGLGSVFRSESKSRQKSNLLIFITPTIVQDEDFQASPSRFLKTPVQTLDSETAGEWSTWNSAKPADWSKIGKKKSATTSGDPLQ